MANAYSTPGSAVADQLQQILAQRRADKQQDLINMLTAQKASVDWQNQEIQNKRNAEADARAQTQLNDQLLSSAQGREQNELGMATTAAENIGGGVDTSTLDPKVAERQRKFGFINSLGMPADSLDGSVKPLEMTSTAPSVKRASALADTDTIRRKGMADEVAGEKDPLRRAILAQTYQMNPVGMNYSQMYNATTGAPIGKPREAGIGTGQTNMIGITPQQLRQPFTVGAWPLQNNAGMATLTAMPDGTTKWSISPVPNGPNGAPIPVDFSSQFGGSRFDNVPTGTGRAATDSTAAYGKQITDQIKSYINNGKLQDDMKLNAITAANTTGIANSPLGKPVTLPSMDNAVVDPKEFVNRTLDGWRKAGRPPASTQQIIQQLQKKFPPGVWENLPVQTQNEMRQLLEIAIDYELTVKPSTGFFGGLF